MYKISSVIPFGSIMPNKMDRPTHSVTYLAPLFSFVEFSLKYKICMLLE
jgi:hypothetical protein